MLAHRRRSARVAAQAVEAYQREAAERRIMRSLREVSETVRSAQLTTVPTQLTAAPRANSLSVRRGSARPRQWRPICSARRHRGATAGRSRWTSSVRPRRRGRARGGSRWTSSASRKTTQQRGTARGAFVLVERGMVVRPAELTQTPHPAACTGDGAARPDGVAAKDVLVCEAPCENPCIQGLLQIHPLRYSIGCNFACRIVCRPSPYDSAVSQQMRQTAGIGAA
eukprot:COSAG01_NODE_2705_length_7221_cov_80.513760_2_plen_225_part_00